ncbi:hypothetical protein AMJ80_11895 [bacterium SM23_31]|nr:MAG: hypothetical protein AMJ80_11895 [bacterium SM23_31]
MIKIHLNRHGFLGKVFRLIVIAVLVLIVVQFAAEKCTQNQKITHFKDKYLKTVLDNYFTLN